MHEVCGSPSTLSPPFTCTSSASHSSLTSCTSSCTSSTTLRAVASLCTPPKWVWTLLTRPTPSQVRKFTFENKTWTHGKSGQSRERRFCKRALPYRACEAWGGLEPGGFEGTTGRHAVHFTLVNPRTRIQTVTTTVKPQRQVSGQAPRSATSVHCRKRP